MLVTLVASILERFNDVNDLQEKNKFSILLVNEKSIFIKFNDDNEEHPLNILSIFPLNLLYFGKIIYFKDLHLIKILLNFAFEKLNLDKSREIKENEE